MSSNAVEISFRGQTLLLLPDKAMFWKEQHMLVVSDVHFGKSGHFRKHGIAVPNTVNNSNILRIEKIIDQLKPEKVLFLGDLFHSDSNSEIENFKNWRTSHSEIHMILTIGNHDILMQSEYENMNLECVKEYKFQPFSFIHDQNSAEDHSAYFISGHIHPAVKLSAKGRQNLYVPCFYFGKQGGMLPAFGTFTGNYRINPAQNDLVYGVVENNVVDISAII